MRKILKTLLLIAAMVCSAPAYAKNDTKPAIPEYQLEGAGMTTDNAQQIRVTILSKKKDVTDADLGKCAVHGALFRDYDDVTNSGFGSAASHKAIMGSPAAEQQHIDYFEPFFANGDCNRYVQVVGDSRRVVKAGKQWKVSAVVKVNTAALRKELRSRGLIKDLGSGW